MRVWRERFINAAPDAIWKLIATVESIPLWMSSVESAEYLSGPAEGVGRMQRLYRQLRYHLLETDQEIVSWEPGRKMSLVHRRELFRGREVSGVREFTMTLTLTEFGGSSVVRVEYRWKASLGLSWLKSVVGGGRVMGGELIGTLKKIGLLAGDASPKAPPPEAEE